ncbi:MAG TPA: hypothetical protein VFO89_08380 [Thermoanaerobaculia bacterium]|nr:hypothetical protein [Thermoanaerobaculia bacterium]
MKKMWIVAAIAASLVSFSLFAQEGAGSAVTATTTAAVPASGAAEGSAEAPAGSSGVIPMIENVRAAEGPGEDARFLEEKGANVVQLGDEVIVTVAGWSALRAKATDAAPVTLTINGLDSKLDPIGVAVLEGDRADLSFDLDRTDENKDLWRGILRDPTEAAKPLQIGVGISGANQPLPLAPGAKNGTVLLDKLTLSGVGVIWLVVMALLVGGLLYYGATSDMLRNGPMRDGKKQPFSLARTQMAWWFVLIILGYILIWTFTGDRDSIPASLLALMGISASTALGAVIVDNGKEQRNAAATENLEAQKTKLAASKPADDPSASKAVDDRITSINQTIAARNGPKERSSFLLDLLTDDNGQVALHRYQIVGWTVVLGIIFIATVIHDLSMPEFNGTLLALMGISSGTYLGFKMPG